jgi:hypothetical protein
MVSDFSDTGVIWDWLVGGGGVKQFISADTIPSDDVR